MKKDEKIAQLKSLYGKTIDCETVFNSICEDGEWKYDTEESDLLLCFMRTWKKECYIAKIVLEDGICAPPYGEEGVIAEITFGKFNKDEYVKIPKFPNDLGDEDPEYFLAKYGDPNYALELENIKFKDIPDAIFDELFDEIFLPLSESILE
jgi:hypothetical protein